MIYRDLGDEIEREENDTTVIIKDFIKAIFYCVLIQFINYCLKLPAILSILPLMALLLAFMLFTRYWNNKKRQYAFLIPFVAEYFGFVLYFYNRGHLMFLTAFCMTAILAAWGVVCIECFVKEKKRNLIGFLTLALVALIAYFLIWNYYSAKAQAIVRKNAETTAISERVSIGEQTDALCRELNVVFYGKTRLTFRAQEAAQTALERGGVYQSLDQEMRVNLSKVQGKWISSLFREARTLSENMENIVEKE